MPRTLDVDGRDRQVMEAAWRIIARDGVQALTVRTVAAEAGLPPSSLRYTFPTQTSVRQRAIEGMLGRMTARVDALPESAGAAAWARAALLEVLPLDAERRTEMQVCVALGAAALTDPSLAPLYAVLEGQVADVCRRAAAALGRTSQADVDLFFALVDGLALHLVHEPAGSDPAWALAALDRYLAEPA